MLEKKESTMEGLREVELIPVKNEVWYKVI